jgi:flagellar hook-basal body complex protein FliE
MTSPISSVSSIAPIDIGQGITPAAGSGSSNIFANVLQNTIGSMQSMQADANSTIEKFLSGENDDLHTTVLATQRADLAFELGLQLRNKVVSAYQEVMKMQL